jgi:transcriptional regulator of arginine metabolism
MILYSISLMEKDTILDSCMINIVQNETIKEQADLQEKLKQQGYNIPQATLSRRLKKLKIAKLDGVYRVVGAHTAHLPTILKMQVSDSGLIVMHTHPGQASSLAYFLDSTYVHCAEQQTILGTIAGDDTVLIITQGQKNLADVLAKLGRNFPYLYRIAKAF